MLVAAATDKGCCDHSDIHAQLCAIHMSMQAAADCTAAPHWRRIMREWLLLSYVAGTTVYCIICLLLLSSACHAWALQALFVRRISFSLRRSGAAVHCVTKGLCHKGRSISAVVMSCCHACHPYCIEWHGRHEQQSHWLEVQAMTAELLQALRQNEWSCGARLRAFCVVEVVCLVGNDCVADK
jgi:hypothetical protein